MFDEIKDDKYVKGIFKKISEIEVKDVYWVDHGLCHANNVVHIVENILTHLKYNNNFIEQSKIAALLHDIGNIYGRDNHAYNSFTLAKEYFIRNNIDTGDNHLVLEAIRYHSNGISGNNIASILVLADKLDIKKDRLRTEGLKIEGLKEIRFIDDIIIDVLNNTFRVNFLFNEKVNRKSLETFYFTTKVFNAINNFAKELHLEPLIMDNNSEWRLKNNS